MASITREIIIDATPEKVWSVVGDFARGPLQSAPGVFTDCRLVEPGVRALHFVDGTIAKERLVARDEATRRIVWGWIGDEVAHDNTSMQVFAAGEKQTRLVWIHDTLPDELVGWLAPAMDRLAPIFQETLRGGAD